MAKLQISFRDLYRSLDEVGENPLRNAHDKLDKAVIAAYAMPDDADILAFLLDLNSVCAAKEANGESIQGPGFPLKPDQLGDFITEDCIKPLPL